MKSNSLFQILVIGGATLASQFTFAEDNHTFPIPMGKTVVACHRNDANTCEMKEVNGKMESVPKEGIECRQGTSCAVESCWGISRDEQ